MCVLVGTIRSAAGAQLGLTRVAVKSAGPENVRPVTAPVASRVKTMLASASPHSNASSASPRVRPKGPCPLIVSWTIDPSTVNSSGSGRSTPMNEPAYSAACSA